MNSFTLILHQPRHNIISLIVYFVVFLILLALFYLSGINWGISKQVLLFIPIFIFGISVIIGQNLVKTKVKMVFGSDKVEINALKKSYIYNNTLTFHRDSLLGWKNFNYRRREYIYIAFKEPNKSFIIDSKSPSFKDLLDFLQKK